MKIYTVVMIAMIVGALPFPIALTGLLLGVRVFGDYNQISGNLGGFFTAMLWIVYRATKSGKT